MEFTGQIKSINNDFISGNTEITFTVNEKQTILPEYENLKYSNKLKIEVCKYRNKRSKDANAYLWVLLQKMAEVLKSDKWTLYLQMLKKYGQFTYIVVKPNVVDAVRAQWRECEELGEITINGTKGIQLLCYFGSSNYDTKEMSELIDGVVREAQDLDIDTISPQELKEMKERWNV